MVCDWQTCLNTSDGVCWLSSFSIHFFDGKVSEKFALTITVHEGHIPLAKKAFSWLSAIPRYFFRKAVFADLTPFTKYLLMQCFTADGDNEDFPMLVFTTGYRNILNFRINALWNSPLPNCACMCLCAWCEVRSQLQILAENRRIFLFYFLVFGAKYEDCASTIELSAFYLFFLLHQKELLHCQPVNIAKCNISTNC